MYYCLLHLFESIALGSNCLFMPCLASLSALLSPVVRLESLMLSFRASGDDLSIEEDLLGQASIFHL